MLSLSRRWSLSFNAWHECSTYKSAVLIRDYSTAESVEKFNPLRMKVSSYREDAFRAGMMARPGRRRVSAHVGESAGGRYVGTVRRGRASVVCKKIKWA